MRLYADMRSRTRKPGCRELRVPADVRRHAKAHPERVPGTIWHLSDIQGAAIEQ
jgi:hypothetical protein